MSQVLSVELADDVYAGILRDARRDGTSPAQVAEDVLARRYRSATKPLPSADADEEVQLSAERFERHFGSVDLGYATGSDNESIDADLAREYGSTHEEE